MTKSSIQSSIQPSILELLTAEHRSIEHQVDRLETVEQAIEAGQRFRELYRIVTLYHYGKTLVFYPAMREYEQTASYLETAEEELSSIKILLEQMRQLNPAAPLFQAKLDELKEAVMAHIEEEENEIFAAVQACMSEQELRRLARELRQIQTKTAPKIEARIKKSNFLASN